MTTFDDHLRATESNLRALKMGRAADALKAALGDIERLRLLLASADERAAKLRAELEEARAAEASALSFVDQLTAENARLRDALRDASEAAWLESCAKDCKCCQQCGANVPCPGVQAGGICDAYCRCEDESGDLAAAEDLF
jgi:chromosome segregation ATPase